MKTLRIRLITTWLLISLPPLVVFGVVSLLVARDQIDTALRERVSTASEGVQLALASARERTLLRAKAFAQSPALQRAMADGDHAAVVTLAEQARELLGVDRLTVLDERGNVAARGHAPARYGDQLARTATSLELTTKKPQSVTGVGDGGTGTQVSVPIIGPADSFLGTILVQQPIDYLSLLELKRQFGVDFAVWEGTRLQATTLRTASAVRQAGEARQALALGGPLHQGHDYYFASATSADPRRAAVLATVSLDDTRMLERRLGWWFVLVATGATGLALFAAYFAARRIVRPVRRLAEAADAAARGDLDAPIIIDETDEIGELGMSFRSMLERRREVERELRDTQATLEERVETRTRELKQSEEHLSQARRLEALGRLAGGVAHDFNNVLTAIGGNAELAVSDLDPLDVTSVRESLEEIRRGAAHAAELVQQLMAFGRSQSREAIVIDLGEVVSSSEKLLGRLLTEDAVLHLKIEVDRLSVRADPTQVGQILVNLVVNAQQALRAGGNVWVEVRRHEQHEPSSYVPAGTYACLEVRDDGSGMDHQTAERIFEPFFTTKGPGQGTGMGLATVHGIVKQSGAHIEVDSHVGRGTRFRILFPIVGEESTPKTPEFEATSPASGETILVCEDEPSVRNVASEFLLSAGYRVLVSSSGTEALAIARTQAKIHLLLTDVVMPEMNGVELARNLHAIMPDLRIVYVSGYTANVLDSRTRAEGVTDLLAKPFTRATLLARVRAALDSPPPTRRVAGLADME